MPADDPVNTEANRWLEAIRKGEPKPQEAQQAAKVQALAADLGLDAERLAERIPADTLRRLKYPVLEHRLADGTTAFTHDLGISNQVRPLLGTDRAYGEIPTNTPARTPDGKFQPRGGVT